MEIRHYFFECGMVTLEAELPVRLMHASFGQLSSHPASIKATVGVKIPQRYCGVSVLRRRMQMPIVKQLARATERTYRIWIEDPGHAGGLSQIVVLTQNPPRLSVHKNDPVLTRHSAAYPNAKSRPQFRLERKPHSFAGTDASKARLSCRAAQCSFAGRDLCHLEFSGRFGEFPWHCAIFHQIDVSVSTEVHGDIGAVYWESL